jgi:hypothetical protein
MRSTKVSSKETKALARQNIRLAKCLTRARLGVNDFHRQRHLTTRFGFSLAIGDLQLLNGSWYVTHSGLLRLAERNHCSGIRVQPIGEFCDPNNGRWVFKATVYKSPCSKGFVGYGDADPSNVSFLVGGAEMRVAETRAVNRALRKAYGIGLCSVEELSSPASPAKSSTSARQSNAFHPARGSNNGSSRPTFRSLVETQAVSSGNSCDLAYRIPLHRSSGAIHKFERDFSLRLLRGALASSSDRRVSEKPAGHLFSFRRDCMRTTSFCQYFS